MFPRIAPYPKINYDPIKIPTPYGGRFSPIFEDLCDSLSDWTTSGTVDILNGKIHLNASHATASRLVDLPKVLPTIITAEVTLTYNPTSVSFRLKNANDTNVCTFAYNSTSAGVVTNYSPITGHTNTTNFDNTVTSRFYLLFDPVNNVVRGWIQDDGSNGAVYMGEAPTSGVPVTFEIGLGDYGGNEVLVDNIICTPVYAVAIGDSRVSGHGGSGYDPFPDYYAGDDNLYHAFPYNLYKDIGAYVINSGIGSTQPSFTANRFVEQALNFKPQVVVIGTSNNGGDSVETYKQKYAEMAETAKNAGVSVIFLEMTPSDNQTYLADRYEINRFLHDYCKEKGHTLVEMYDALSDDDTLDNKFDCGDGTHPNELGYRFMAELIARKI